MNDWRAKLADNGRIYLSHHAEMRQYGLSVDQAVRLRDDLTQSIRDKENKHVC